MKFYLFIIVFLFLPFSAFAKINIVTTIPDFAAIAQEVGGDLVEAKSICRGDQDPHYLEAKPSYAVLLNKADLLIEVGLELEVGWLPVLLTQSRNPKIQRGAEGHLDASQGLSILEIPTGRVDRSMGDVHPLGNPHYWLDPRNSIEISSRIASKLSLIDPVNKDKYQQNANQFWMSIKTKMHEWHPQLSKLRGVKVITHHKSFSYFAHWVGLHVVDVIEPKPGIPPSAAHILKLTELIKNEKIPLLITENYYDPKPGQELAKKTGAKMLYLPTSVGGENGVETYTGLFDHLIKKIQEAP